MALAALAWPAVAVLFGLRYNTQIRTFLENIARAKNIKVGNVEWNGPELDNAIVEREILKSGIALATLDNKYTGREIGALKDLASNMRDYTNSISEGDRRLVIKSIIDMALSDNQFTVSEYNVVQDRAKQIKSDAIDIDNLIIDACIERGVRPLPPNLASLYDQRKTPPKEQE